MNQELSLQDNATPHTSLCTREAIVTIQRTVCLHPPYSTDLASPNCHLFGTLKDALQECHSADNDELKHSVHVEL